MTRVSDFPSIRPSLMLDFANTKQLDPRITFSRPTTATYYDANGVLKTASAGAARFDHDPVTGESKGLLIEEQRTNINLYSQQFTSSFYTATRINISDNVNVAPDGTQTAAKISPTSVSGSHGIITATVTSRTYTTSIYVKAGEMTKVGVFINNATCIGVDLTNGSTSAITGYSLPTSYSVTPVGNGWYRVSGYQGTASTYPVQVYPVQNFSGFTYTGDGYSGIYVWGAQLEAGAFATSYIPTTSAQVTRSADSASMTGTNFSSWYRADEGTLYAEVNAKSLASTSGAQVNDATANNKVRLALVSTTEQGSVVSGGVAQAALDGGTPSVGISSKMSFGYKANDFALSLDGGSASTALSGTIPAVSQLQIGAELSTIGSVSIKKLAYYPKRLTNTEIQTMTA